MNIIIDRVLTLLSEVDCVCRQNQLNYIAGGLMPEMIFDQKNRDLFQGVIYLKEDEYPTLKALLLGKEQENRAVEIIKSEGHPERTRFIDPTTSFLQYAKLLDYQIPGLNVEIRQVYKNADGTFCFENANEKEVACSLDYFDDLKVYLYKGRTVTMPADLETFYQDLYLGENDKIQIPLYKADAYLASTRISYRSLIDCLPNYQSIGETIGQNDRNIETLSARIDERNEIIGTVLEQVKEMYDIPS